MCEKAVESNAARETEGWNRQNADIWLSGDADPN
jgi:hypothetical protein